MVHEVLQHYLRQGSKPVLVVLDCTKAFNLTKFDILFGRLLEKLPAVVVRVLVYSYTEQVAWVKWGRNCTSETFRIKNGTRQGSVASPVFWSVYLNPLLDELRANGVGCHVVGLLVGVVAYVDDLVLLAPNRSAAQHMLNTCQNFAARNNIRFSTDKNPKKSKSRALYVTGHKGLNDLPVPLMLCDKELPWVEKCEHLGNTLDVTGSMEQDCRNKRAEFIGQCVKLREQFNFAHPTEVILATEKYCWAHYGSNLRQLRCEAASTLFSSWRTHIKLTWNLPRNTRSFFIDSLLAPDISSPRVSLMTRQSRDTDTITSSCQGHQV